MRASMVRFPLPFLFAAALLCSLTSSATAKSRVLDQSHPVVFGIDGGLLLPGQTIHITVTLSGPADGTEAIAVSGSSGFSSIPTYLYPQAGDTTVGFNATLKSGLFLFPVVTLTDGVATLSQILPMLQLHMDDGSTPPVSTIDEFQLP